jgi:hypothetical protein
MMRESMPSELIRGGDRFSEKHALGLGPRDHAPSKARNAIVDRLKTIAPGSYPAVASLSGKRRGKVSLTRVPPSPEVNVSCAPQRAARLRVLRKPRAAV